MKKLNEVYLIGVEEAARLLGKNVNCGQFGDVRRIYFEYGGVVFYEVVN